MFCGDVISSVGREDLTFLETLLLKPTRINMSGRKETKFIHEIIFMNMKTRFIINVRIKTLFVIGNQLSL